MVIRFNLTERIQHIILFVSVIMLILTGLPLVFYDSWIGKFILQIEGGFHGRIKLHNIFAMILISLCIFHAFYVTFSVKGHREIFLLRFTKKDFRDFILNIKYNLGIVKEKPSFGKYNFSQKFQYWAVVFGCIIMIATGIVLLLKVSGSGMNVPKWLWDITIVLHSNLGIVFLLVLFVWHIYDVHLAPGVFPMDWVWLTGKISKEKNKTEHPQEYEEFKENYPFETEKP